MSARPAAIEFGRYRLFERIAAGGMGELFRAESKEHGVCVVKRVLPHLAREPEYVKMLLDEARVAARLQHPGLVRIFDVGNEGPHWFLAFEYLPGEDCHDVMKALQGRGGGLPWRLACAVIAQAADALHFAHEARGGDGRPLDLVHRDVTPSNLFITYGGDVKLLDFGIARSAGRFSVTARNQVKGKSGYLAPEMLAGAPVDRRADVWALGVCLGELATGGPAALGEIAARASATAPSSRYPTAAELSRALAPFLPVAPRDELKAFMREVFGDARADAKLALAGPGRAPEPVRPRTMPLAGDAGWNLGLTQPFEDAAPEGKRQTRPMLGDASLDTTAPGAGDIVVTQPMRPSAAAPVVATEPEPALGVDDRANTRTQPLELDAPTTVLPDVEPATAPNRRALPGALVVFAAAALTVALGLFAWFVAR